MSWQNSRKSKTLKRKISPYKDAIRYCNEKLHILNKLFLCEDFTFLNKCEILQMQYILSNA